MDRHGRIGEAAQNELVSIREHAFFSDDQLCIEVVVEDAAANNVAIIEEPDAVVCLTTTASSRGKTPCQPAGG